MRWFLIKQVLGLKAICTRVCLAAISYSAVNPGITGYCQFATIIPSHKDRK